MAQSSSAKTPKSGPDPSRKQSSQKKEPQPAPSGASADSSVQETTSSPPATEEQPAQTTSATAPTPQVRPCPAAEEGAADQAVAEGLAEHAAVKGAELEALLVTVRKQRNDITKLLAGATDVLRSAAVIYHGHERHKGAFEKCENLNCRASNFTWDYFGSYDVLKIARHDPDRFWDERLELLEKARAGIAPDPGPEEDDRGVTEVDGQDFDFSPPAKEDARRAQSRVVEVDPRTMGWKKEYRNVKRGVTAAEPEDLTKAEPGENLGKHDKDGFLVV